MFLNLSVMDIHTLLEGYKTWWQTYGKAFETVTVKVDGKDCHLTQRQYADPQKYLGLCVEQIPLIEITEYYRKAENGILFVNCNPSGTDYEHYGEENKSQDGFFIYKKEGNPYFENAESFARKVKQGIPYAMIDVFPLVLQNQAVLKKAISEAFPVSKRTPAKEVIPCDAFKAMMERFRDNVLEIKPKVIVATNAFVKDLFTCDDEKHPYSFRKLGLLDSFYQGDDSVYYRIVIPRQGQDAFETFLFCGGMIAGGHQMDTQSKERLIRDVRHFISQKPINLWPPKQQ